VAQGVGMTMGIGGESGARGSVLVVWVRARESVSSRTQTRLFIMWRTPLMLRLLVGRVDASFRVNPRRWRELEAIKNPVSYRGVAS
jgi:hypothetical protein